MLRADSHGQERLAHAPEGPALARPLKVLHRAFMLLRRCSRSKRTQILPLPRLRILLARIQAILSGLQVANHAEGMHVFDPRLGQKEETLTPRDHLFGSATIHVGLIENDVG